MLSSVENTSQDLEAFAKHAGRKTVDVDDVLMLGRRNEGLDRVLRSFVEGQGKRREKKGRR